MTLLTALILSLFHGCMTQKGNVLIAGYASAADVVTVEVSAAMRVAFVGYVQVSSLDDDVGVFDRSVSLSIEQVGFLDIKDRRPSSPVRFESDAVLPTVRLNVLGRQLCINNPRLNPDLTPYARKASVLSSPLDHRYFTGLFKNKLVNRVSFVEFRMFYENLPDECMGLAPAEYKNVYTLRLDLIGFWLNEGLQGSGLKGSRAVD